MTSEIKVDTISEQTSANGVTIDGLTIKDGNIIGDVALAGTTPTFTIGDGGAEDAALIFDGNALDFYIALDDSADDLVIGTGTTIGSNAKFTIENEGNVKITRDDNVFLSIDSTQANGDEWQLFNAVSGTTSQLQFKNIDQSAVVMLLDETGKVGINEVSPTSQLHITGATDAGGTISLKRPNTTVTAGQTLGAIEFITADSGSAGTAARILGEADGTGGEAKLVFNTGTGGSNSTRMIIDHDGLVGIGTSSPSSPLDILTNLSSDTTTTPDTVLTLATKYASTGANGGAGAGPRLEFQIPDDETNPITGAAIAGLKENGDDSNAEAALAFYISQNDTTLDEAMRINSDGSVAIKSTTTDNSILKVQQDTADKLIARFEHHNGSGNNHGLRIENKSQAPDNNTSDFLVCGDTGASRIFIYSDGDIQNHDNAYGAISDERIKQDIRDSNSQWDDIKAVKVRNFKKKDDVRQYGDNAWEQIGVVAQELEAVSPKLIRHNNPTSHDIISSSEFGTLYEDGDDIPQDKKIGDVKEIKEQVKSVNYSILYMKSIKALQEAQTRIETLETKVAALEG